MEGKRLEWLDLAKGIGMVLIMMGHAGLPRLLNREIYTFHVPLFFYLSGYVFNAKKYPNIKKLFGNRVNTLIIPYFSFSLISYCYLLMRYQSHLTTLDSLSLLMGTFIALRGTAWGSPSGPLWFVTCLFIVELMFLIILNYSKSLKRLLWCLLFCSIIGYLYSTYVHLALPWGIDVSLTALPFYGIGYLFRRYNVFGYILSWNYAIIFISLNIIAGYTNIYFLRNFPRVDMFYNSYGNYFLFYLSAVTGICFVIIFCRLIELKEVFRRPMVCIGRYSFVFLAFHQDIIYPLTRDVFAYLLKINLSLYSNKVVLAITELFLAVFILLPIGLLINTQFPYLLGRNKNGEILLRPNSKQ